MRGSITALTALLLFSSCLAMIYDVENVNIIAFPGENLEYKINITNNHTTSKQVYINKIFIDNTFRNQMISIEPSINLIIGSGESEVVDIKIPVSEELARGIYRTLYRTSLFVSYDDDVTDSVDLDAVILSDVIEPLEIDEIEVFLPSSVTPVYDFNITIRAISNVASISPVFRVLVSSDFNIIYESSSIHELVDGVNVFKRIVSLPDDTSPGVFDLLVEAELSGKVISQKISELNVNAYDSVNYSLSISEGLLGKSVHKIVSNNGTVAVTTSVNYTASIIEPLLINRALLLIKEDGVTVSSKEVMLTNNEIIELVTLEPGQSAELVVEFSYGVLFLIPFVVILSVIGWYFFTKRVVIVKEIIECKKEDDDVIIKVGIGVKNVALKSVHNVKIIDDLPIYVRKIGSFGSIRGEINKDKGVVTFNVGRLDPKEEVLISYKFKTDMELVGRVSLPPAIVKYTFKRKVSASRSNTPFIRLIKGGQ
jgi:hypothetical protein